MLIALQLVGRPYEDEKVGSDSRLENNADRDFATGHWDLEVPGGSDRVPPQES